MEMDGGWANIRAKLIQNGVSTLNVDRSNVVSCIIDAYASDQNLHYLPQFYHIGRFVSHAYILTGYFPINLSLVCAKILINGVDVPLSDGEIVSSFYDYIDDFERSALEKTGESLTSDLIARVITPMFTCHRSFSLVLTKIL